MDLSNCNRPIVLLRSGWQTVNIGDIAHSPGVLALLETHVPEAQVIYWSNATDRGVKQMIQRRFPDVQFVRGHLTAQGCDNPELADAVKRAHLLLHGSGPSIVAVDHVNAWLQQTGKPWGALGITVERPNTMAQQVARSAALLFTRDTASLCHLEQHNCRPACCEFGPDGVFALDIRDDQANGRFMTRHGLESGEFAVFVPRLRLTPYHLIRPEIKHDPARVAEVEAVNARWARIDHAKMHEAITRYVCQTGHMAVLVPEMTYQLDIMDELLIQPLPADVKRRVVRRTEYWLPDEAASLYSRAEAVVSFECHSPIIAMAAGTPAIYLRQPEDTIKGQMYYDLGLQDSVFEIEQATGAAIADRLMQLVDNRETSDARLREAMARVGALHGRMMRQVRHVLGLAASVPCVPAVDQASTARHQQG